jgi:hypothetical protein
VEAAVTETCEQTQLALAGPAIEVCQHSSRISTGQPFCLCHVLRTPPGRLWRAIANVQTATLVTPSAAETNGQGLRRWGPESRRV